MTDDDSVLHRTNMAFTFKGREMEALTVVALAEEIGQVPDEHLNVAVGVGMRLVYEAIAQRGLKVIDQQTFTMAMMMITPMTMAVLNEHQRRNPTQYLSQRRWQSSLFSTLNYGMPHPREMKQKVGTNGKENGAQEGSQEEARS